ncbi:MFS transporter [Georgenia ruanii]|uniref:MFS transporter n=1 Tax=Georgenia ruanii TaxID=348442 RepID=UPI00186AE52E
MTRQGDNRWLATVRRPLYRRAWALGTLPHLGYWMVILTFQGMVASQTDADPMALGLFYFATLVPFLLVSLHAGVWADRFDRLRLLAASHLLILAVSASIVTLLLAGRTAPTTFMVSGFVFGLALAASQPAGQALVAESVPRGLTTTAVTLHSFGITLSRFLGPALAAILIAAAGNSLTMVVHCVLCVAIVALALTTRASQTRGSAVSSSFSQSIRSGAAHATERWPFMASLMAVGAVSLFGSSYLSQIASLATLATDDSTWFAVLMSATGLGAIVGVVLAAVPMPTSWDLRRICTSMLGLGLCVGALGWARSEPVQLVLVMAAAACQFTTLTLCFRVIQGSIANSHRGRVMSLNQLCYAGLIPVGGLLLGLSWAWVGPSAAFSSAGAFVIGAATVLILRVWSLDPRFPLEQRAF